MSTDRSKFKATSVATMKNKDKQIESSLGKGGNYAGRHKILDGLNTFRICPYHPDGGGDVYAEPVVVWYLPCDVPERDDDRNIKKDGKGKAIMKRISKPIFHARVHGSSKKDLVEEYVKFTKKWADDTYSSDKDKNEKQAYLKPLNPIQGKGGLAEKETWGCYAYKIHNGVWSFGLWEFGKAVRYRLDQIAASESGSDPLGTDPFTDVEDGIAVNITYNSKAGKPQDYYVTEKAPETEGQGKNKTIISYALSDAQIDELLAAQPLVKMFRGVYGRKDFDFALQGLQNFDKENNMGIFQHDEWLDIVEDLSKEYSEEGQEEEEEGGDEFDAMDREELKEFNKENQCGILIKKAHTDDQLRDLLREWKSNQEEPEEEEESEEEEQEEEEESEDDKKKSEKAKFIKDLNDEEEEENPIVKKKSGSSLSAKDRLAEARNRIKNK